MAHKTVYKLNQVYKWIEWIICICFWSSRWDDRERRSTLYQQTQSQSIVFPHNTRTPMHSQDKRFYICAGQ